MKAAVYTKYGPPEVLRIEDVEKPVPKDDEVLIEIHAATVNRTDTGFRSAQYFVSRFFSGLPKPKKIVAGSEFAGKIVQVGSTVTEFKVGDKVFGFEDVRSGAHAEYMTNAASGAIAKMPEGFSYQETAPAGEGATYALSGIRAAGVKKGQKVLVYGASGAIGSAAVQILVAHGAKVTAVCGTKNVKLVKSLGADKVIDYQTEDFTQLDDKFDFILDAVGKSSYGVCKKLLAPKGKYCSTELGPYGQNPLLAIWFAITGSRKVIFPIPKIGKEQIEYIRQLMESGAYKPVVDRTYPLDEIVEASKYVESGQKTGNVVIKIT
ncbi:MAG TPA: NAD(P)-dependent alcohol dehydrogenase [Candidatus Limnocylindria bacterium]|nr:NAD(P)-dependent alcohol dehydrogenase [Candidatus Limnocylindria bacterium]